MVVSEHTRSQDLKQIEESLKAMVTEILTENNKKQEEMVTEMINKQSELMGQQQNTIVNELKALLLSSHPAPTFPTPINPTVLPNPPFINLSSSQTIPTAIPTPTYIDLSQPTIHTQAAIGNGYQMATRFTKIESPTFNGEDLEGWLFKCERFFQIDYTLLMARMKLASIHMEGRALNKLGEPPWEEYVLALKGRFGEKAYEDPMADLKGLIQTGTLQEYMESFEVLSHKVTLSEDYSLSCFLSGLKEEIRIPLRMLGPKSLQQAYALARMQDSYLSATKTIKPIIINPKQPVIPTQILSPSPNLHPQTLNHHYYPHLTLPKE
ncbi:conserved hypothetical protein [Ricinus communis]|uniref:Retrotransposon gag domain-containing protein n=1 Tax=Ricinus communis TaxID=3988 RepID=B9SNM0_RICCO|nr:conserved hypothetical protein [Ricinus communis]